MVSFGYLSMIVLLRLTAIRLSESTIKPLMMVYNGIQVAFNLIMVIGLAKPLWLDHRDRNLFAFNTPYQASIEFWIWVHYLSKIVDWMDTVWMLLRGKTEQVTFLHVYHHSTIQCVWGYLLLIGHANGTIAFGAVINSFVHVVMYAHYLMTSLNLQTPFKKIVTSLQIGQFYLCLLHAVLVFTDWDGYVPSSLASLQVIYMISMVVLFSQFFRHTYSKK